MATDLDKVNKFCSQIVQSGYPDVLKNLKGISQKTVESLLQVIDKFQRKYNVNDSVWVECELVRRFLIQPPFLNKTFKKIQGPISIYQLSHKQYPHIFYLFGDRHFIQQSACPKENKISQYIKDTIVNSPIFIDVYVEETYIHKEHVSYDYKSKDPKGYMIETVHMFDDCFSKKKDFIPCQTSRFHYSDPRWSFETESQLNGYELIYSLTPGGFLRSGYEKKEILDMVAFVDYIKNDNSLIHERIKKQIKNIGDSSIRKIIRDL